MDFVERVENTTGLGELRTQMAATLGHFGVTNFSMVGMIAEREGEVRAPTTLIRRLDDDWADHYWEKGQYNIDPVVHTALQRYTSFSWRDLEHGRQPKQVKHLFAEVREAMSIDGSLVVPTHDEEGFAGLVALYHEDPELSERAHQALKLISLYAVERAKELYAMRGVEEVLCPLTPRQREVLSYVARGETDWEIGVLLTIAESTVNGHVEDAKRALGVRTRMQAVAIALRRGWISL